jgi:hypothetical protein
LARTRELMPGKPRGTGVVKDAWGGIVSGVGSGCETRSVQIKWTDGAGSLRRMSRGLKLGHPGWHSRGTDSLFGTLSAWAWRGGVPMGGAWCG